MQFSNHLVKSKEGKFKSDDNGGYNCWAQRIIQKFDLPYENINEIGYVFIYLVDESDRTVSYCKMNASDFSQPKDWEFKQFIVDPCVNEVQDKRKGGIIQFRCFLR